MKPESSYRKIEDLVPPSAEIIQAGNDLKIKAEEDFAYYDKVFDSFEKEEKSLSNLISVIRIKYSLLQSAINALIDNSFLAPESIHQSSLDEVRRYFSELISLYSEFGQELDDLGYVIEEKNVDDQQINDAKSDSVLLGSRSKGLDQDNKSKNEQDSNFESSEKARLREVYRRWQEGDIGMFNDDSLNTNLHNIKKDLSRICVLAGYSQEELDKIYEGIIKPWSARVASKRKNHIPEVSFEDLAKEILNKIKPVLQGRELSEGKLRRFSDKSLAHDPIFSSANPEQELKKKSVFLDKTVNEIINHPNFEKVLYRKKVSLRNVLEKYEQATKSYVKLRYLNMAERIIAEIQDELKNPGQLSEEDSDKEASTQKVDGVMEDKLVADTENTEKMFLADIKKQAQETFDNLNRHYKASNKHLKESYESYYAQALNDFQELMALGSSVPVANSEFEEIKDDLNAFNEYCDEIIETVKEDEFEKTVKGFKNKTVEDFASFKEEFDSWSPKDRGDNINTYNYVFELMEAITDINEIEADSLDNIRILYYKFKEEIGSVVDDFQDPEEHLVADTVPEVVGVIGTSAESDIEIRESTKKYLESRLEAYRSGISFAVGEDGNRKPLQVTFDELHDDLRELSLEADEAKSIKAELKLLRKGIANSHKSIKKEKGLPSVDKDKIEDLYRDINRLYSDIAKLMAEKISQKLEAGEIRPSSFRQARIEWQAIIGSENVPEEIKNDPRNLEDVKNQLDYLSARFEFLKSQGLDVAILTSADRLIHSLNQDTSLRIKSNYLTEMKVLFVKALKSVETSTTNTSPEVNAATPQDSDEKKQGNAKGTESNSKAESGKNPSEAEAEVMRKVDSVVKYYTDLVSALSLLGLGQIPAMNQARKLAESIYTEVEQATTVEEKQEKVRIFQEALLEASKIKSKGESGEIEDDWMIVRIQGDKVLLFKQVGGQNFNDSVLISELMSYNNESTASVDSTQPIPPVSSTTPASADEKYREAKSELRRTKNEDGTEGVLLKTEYREAKKAYDEALKDHYKDLSERTRLGSIKDGLLKKLGLRPELPPEILALEKEYKEKRKGYAVKLDAALAARAEVRAGAEGSEEPWYKPGSTKAKIAFGQKFVLRPRAEHLKLQEDFVLSEEQKSLMKKIMPALARNKHFIRAGSVAASSVLGFFTGGAGTALAYGGYKIGKMVAGAVVGTYAAKAVNELTQVGVNAAERNIEQKQADVKEKFDVNDLDVLEDALLDAEAYKQDRIKVQKRLTVAAAMAGGFSAGAYDHDSVTSYWRDAVNGNGAEVANPEAIPGTVEFTVEGNNVGGTTENIPRADVGSSSGVEQGVKIEYTVKPGDNVSTIFHKNLLTQFDQGNLKLPEGMTRGELSKMMYTKFPELTDAKNPNWTLSPEEWKELGVKSGNPALIRSGETIDVAKLLEKFNDTSVKSGQSGVVQQPEILGRRTGVLPITSDSGERVIPINYAPVRPDEFGVPDVTEIPDDSSYYNTNGINYGEELPRTEVPPVIEKQYSPASNDASQVQAVYTEQGGASVSKATHSPEVTYNGPKAPTTMSPIEGQYFKSPEFVNYLKANGLTVEMMTKVVDKTVEDFEGKTYTRTEEIFGGFDSPYKELSGVPMKELLLMHMKADGDEQALMQMLQEKAPNANFKPETLRVWTKVVDGIVTNNKVPFGETTAFKDVFERHISQSIVEHKFRTGSTVLDTGGKKSFLDLFKANLEEGARKNFVRNSVRMDSVFKK